MNHRRNRNHNHNHRSSAVDGYLRYLKPGALAQLRDRKINAKTHSQISPVSVRSTITAAGSGQQSEPSDGELPVMEIRAYGPMCPQRKKLMAVRSVLYSEPLDNNLLVVD